MFVINSSESNSKLTKAIAIISMITVATGLFIQVIGLLSFTDSKIGKLIRKGILRGSCRYMDDSIDVVQEKMPAWMAKLEKLG